MLPENLSQEIETLVQEKVEKSLARFNPQEVKIFQLPQNYIDKLFEVIEGQARLEQRFNNHEKRLEQILQEIHASREEWNKRFEKMEQRFEKVDQRFEKMDQRFESLQREMNLRFESLQQEMNLRFESLQREMNQRFESVQQEMNQRFEKVYKDMYELYTEQTKQINRSFIRVIISIAALMATIGGLTISIIVLINKLTI